MTACNALTIPLTVKQLPQNALHVETLPSQTTCPQPVFVLEQTESSSKARTFASVKKDSSTRKTAKIYQKKTALMTVGNKSIQTAQEMKPMILMVMNVFQSKTLVAMCAENTEVDES